MRKLNLLFFSILFIFPLYIFSQVNSSLITFSDCIKKKANEFPKEVNFNKAQFFLFKKELGLYIGIFYETIKLK